MAIAISDESEFAEGGKAFPPGFRFHPTDEELVLYYLKRKICHHRIILDVIAEIDVYKCDPQDLPGSSKLKTGDRQWFFFSPRDRKYPNGARSNRASKHGYWKVTGKDRIIKCNSRTVGVKKTLVFYRGRAPSKERTDWVMHEYTLDEDELKRCPDAKEYFALYKVYKKSGPGPKNGEQYGAPFKEEDWADDDCFGFEALFNSDSLTKQSNEKTETVPVENELDSSFIALEEFMNQIAEEDLPLVNYENALEHLLGDEVTQSTSVNYAIEPQFDQNNVDFTQLYEAPEVTSAAQNTQVEENYLEDYLEMDDLIDPQPNSQILSLSNFDLFHDADMFVNEGEHSEISQPYTNSFDLVIDESRENFYPVFNLENETMSHQQSQLAEPTLSSTSGVVNDSIYENIQTGSNQNGNEESSWLSAALWSFVESIPTTPASAADNAIVNKAFERISSFSRVRINSITPNNASSTSTSNSNSSSVSCRKSKNGLVYFSIIGALCAILWVILGIAVKVLSRYVFS